MSVRDPHLLIPRLMDTCASHGKFFFFFQHGFKEKTDIRMLLGQKIVICWVFPYDENTVLPTYGRYGRVIMRI